MLAGNTWSYSRAELSHNKDKTLDFSALESSQGARSKASRSRDASLMRRGVNEETARAGERDFDSAKMEEETAVLIYSRATTPTRTRGCQKTPSPIIHPVVCTRKLLPVINRWGDWQKMEALRAKRIKSGKFSCYYMSTLDEGSLLLLLFIQLSPRNKTDP